MRETLAPGTRLGPYEILSTIGAGGMGRCIARAIHVSTAGHAFLGCNRLCLLGPNLIDQTQLEVNVVEAARAAGVEHIVKQPVMGAATDEFGLARVHRPVEKCIEAILRGPSSGPIASCRTS